MGVEHYLNMSAPLLLRFGSDDVLKIRRKRMNRLINYEGVCRTAPATPGLLNTKGSIQEISYLPVPSVSSISPSLIA